MHQYGISHLPVVDDKNNLLGIVAEKTLLQVFANEDDGIIHLKNRFKNANSNRKQEPNSISAASDSN